MTVNALMSNSKHTAYLIRLVGLKTELYFYIFILFCSNLDIMLEFKLKIVTTVFGSAQQRRCLDNCATAWVIVWFPMPFSTRVHWRDDMMTKRLGV